MILPVVLCGGSGSRLWPLSRAHYPKQFIDLLDDKTMLQQTISRLEDMKTFPPYVICNEEHRFLVAEQLRTENISHGSIILEPVGRNTAPAIALAALQSIALDQDPLLLVLAADHVFTDTTALQKTLNNGVEIASTGKLVTFGVEPTEPHTGYGYIRKSINYKGDSFKVGAFVEKPDETIAKSYFNSGDYLWNSGIFLFKASRYIQELALFAPDILKQCQLAIEGQKPDLDFTRVDKAAFEACRDESIDYAVMEKTSDAIVVPMRAGWNDIGSWSSLWDVSKKDSHNNVLQGDIITIETSNSLIRADDKLVATVGVENLIVIDTKDAILVANQNNMQQVKEIVNFLKENNRSEYLQHREIYQPWGKHDHIAEGDRYHVKKIIVNPGKKTAIQAHYHRSEHWIVVSGTAKVHKDNKNFIVTENESIYIPAGIKHALENPGKLPLEIIEVRSGDYLQEDDVVRFVEGE